MMQSKSAKRRQTNTLLICFMAALCGIVAIYFLIATLYEFSFVNNSITTQGTIVDEGKDYSKHGPTRYVVVQFTDAQDMTQTKTIYETDGGFSSLFSDPMGQTVPIRYLANDPSRVELDGTSDGKIQTYLELIILGGLFFLALGTWGAIRLVRKPRPKPFNELVTRR